MTTSRRIWTPERARAETPGLGMRLIRLNWTLVGLICLAASLGFAMLYSAAGGNLDPWASRQIVRFGAGLVIMLALALTDIRLWLHAAYPFYGLALALLLGVEFAGIGSGAQRWIALGPVTLQPSELMKVAVVLALARWFHGIDDEHISRPYSILPPILLVAIPTALVLRQPDLGTAVMLAAGGAVMLFLAGVSIWLFIAGAFAVAAAGPVVWSLLKEYQKQRVLTFLDPETDPLGAGYHILQSKIALGSGGLFGKGFLNGSQAHLSFLPEKQTDFIFTMLAEELGMAGGVFLLLIYVVIIIYCAAIGLRCRNRFGRLLSFGVAATFFFYAFINIAMVMGLLPVVGVPLPLVSYGGTAMLTLQLGFGLVLCASVFRERLEDEEPD